MPISNPDPRVMPNEVKRPNIAAASPGTTSSGSVLESSWVIDADIRPTTPISTLIRTVLANDIAFGDSPMYIACISFSAAARVPMPKRVQR